MHEPERNGYLGYVLLIAHAKIQVSLCLPRRILIPSEASYLHIIYILFCSCSKREIIRKVHDIHELYAAQYIPSPSHSIVASPASGEFCLVTLEG